MIIQEPPYTCEKINEDIVKLRNNHIISFIRQPYNYEMTAGIRVGAYLHYKGKKRFISIRKAKDYSDDIDDAYYFLYFD